MDWGSEGRRRAKQWTRDRCQEVGKGKKNMILALLTRTRRTESKTSWATTLVAVGQFGARCRLRYLHLFVVRLISNPTWPDKYTQPVVCRPHPHRLPGTDELRAAPLILRLRLPLRPANLFPDSHILIVRYVVSKSRQVCSSCFYSPRRPYRFRYPEMRRMWLQPQ